jgi:chromatin assembly factor 1 subunit A
MIDTTPSTSNANPVISAFSVLDGRGSSAAPPSKKQKLTFQEKELRKTNKEIKEKERAEEKARKDAKTQQQAEEKARKEAERKKKEAEREEKRVAQEAERVAKEEKRRKKEEEKQKAEEEKAKKERSQMKLGTFFNIPVAASKPRAGTPDSRGRASMSPAPQLSNPSVASPASFTPSKSERTPYEKLFPDFFIQNGVTVAPITRFERDEEATNVLQKTMDSYLSGDKTMDHRRPLNATELFHRSGHSLVPRGKRFMPVREIMAEYYTGNSSRPIDLTTDSQNTQIKRTGDLLRKIPLKYLRFQEDVRPPYRGTYTSRPVSGMTRLARNPLRRDLPETNYDYDSEAEWVEDEDEAGEDLKSDDEDEDVDDGRDDMDGFLDDEADETANSRRLVIQGDLEPISTGLCWEDRSKRSTNVKMMQYRMEVILGIYHSSSSLVLC